MNIEEDDIPETIRRSKGYIGHFHVSEPNRKVPYHTSRIPWKKVGAALREIGYDKSVIVESFYKTGGEQGHNMRMWRDLAEDLSLEGRLALKSGSMRGVQTFAGYKLNSEGKPTHVVVIMVNQFTCKRSAVRNAMTNFLLRQFRG